MARPIDWKIVLIDDEEDIRDVMTLNLEDAGYKVAAAQDGEAGLRLCEKLSPQIIITDIRMPKMDGLQVLEAAKKQDPHVEVIVATAYGEMDLAIRALQLDASDFITKPINDQALHLALKRAEDRYASRKQLSDYTALLEDEKAQTVQELIKTFSYQKNLIEGSMDGILGCDAEEKVMTFNKAMEQMLGYSKAEAVGGLTLSRFFSPGREAGLKEALISENFGGQDRLFMYETQLLGPGGQTIPVQVSAAVIYNRGEKDGLVFFFRDLREIRRLEREVSDQAKILHQDKMMSLGRLAASVVHEINNPLSGILNYARLMTRVLDRGRLTGGQAEKFRRYLELVENESNRCSRIVSSLLAFSRRSEPEFKDADVSDLINRSILLSRHKLELQGISLNTALDPDVPAIQGDINQLQQCVINLIFNAIDAMPGGGELFISSAFDRSEGQVTITVRDTGQGIAPENLEHIFEPFFTTKKEGYGVGLGLSTVHGIIQRHNGIVEVKSHPGQGVAFIIKLPA